MHPSCTLRPWQRHRATYFCSDLDFMNRKLFFLFFFSSSTDTSSPVFGHFGGELLFTLHQQLLQAKEKPLLVLSRGCSSLKGKVSWWICSSVFKHEVTQMFAFSLKLTEGVQRLLSELQCPVLLMSSRGTSEWQWDPPPHHHHRGISSAPLLLSAAAFPSLSRSWKAGIFCGSASRVCSQSHYYSITTSLHCSNCSLQKDVTFSCADVPGRPQRSKDLSGELECLPADFRKCIFSFHLLSARSLHGFGNVVASGYYSSVKQDTSGEEKRSISHQLWHNLPEEEPLRMEIKAKRHLRENMS